MEENNFDSSKKKINRRRRFVRKGDLLENVVLSTQNIIINVEQVGNGKEVVIVGTGYSLSIDSSNRITQCDPFMQWPDLTIFRSDITIMTIYFPFECKGLKEAGKEICKFANQILGEKIFVLHSKCGICIALTCRMLKGRADIVTISTPFQGTIVADKKKVLKKLNWLERKIYSLVFSDHKVDRDIMPNSTIIQKADYSGLKSHNHINVISICPGNSKKIVDKLLCYLDAKLSIRGDGIVSEESQKMIGIRTIRITSTHASSFLEGIEKVIKYYIPYI